MSRVALVTGGGRGVGRVLVDRLVADGWSVAVTGRTPVEVPGALTIAGDTTVRADVELAVRRAAEELGPLDLVVPNAGRFATGGPLWESDPADWWRDVEVNLLGPVLVLHAALPAMVARGSGRVVLLGSGFAYRDVSHASAYAASKAALQKLGEGVAAELAGTGVAVFTVSPGLVRTDMTEAFPEGFTAHNPGFAAPERWGDPQHLVDLVLRLTTGGYDALSGRFVNVTTDLDVAVQAVVTRPRGGTLGLVPWTA